MMQMAVERVFLDSLEVDADEALVSPDWWPRFLINLYRSQHSAIRFPAYRNRGEGPCATMMKRTSHDLSPFKTSLDQTRSRLAVGMVI